MTKIQIQKTETIEGILMEQNNKTNKQNMENSCDMIQYDAITVIIIII